MVAGRAAYAQSRENEAGRGAKAEGQCPDPEGVCLRSRLQAFLLPSPKLALNVSSSQPSSGHSRTVSDRWALKVSGAHRICGGTRQARLPGALGLGGSP